LYFHSHDHYDHHHHRDEIISGNKRGLQIALGITATVMLLEFVGGIWTNSLALLSDSGHMLSDSSALVLSLMAMWFATRPASSRKTYGYYRFEILAALANGVTLFVIAIWITIEAVQRFFTPPEVASGTMIVIAVFGLLANLASAWFLMRRGDVEGNINLRSAYLHVLGDALGSVGAIIAGILMMVFGWYVADPIISVVVALLILKSAWDVVRNSIHILMEGTPLTLQKSDVEASLKQITSVKNVHDLHIWTITSGQDSLSCHLLIDEDAEPQVILQKAIQIMERIYKIQHTTIQIETKDFQHNHCDSQRSTRLK
jgi:cobalt-zinc-cadmium efflux system protein